LKERTVGYPRRKFIKIGSVGLFAFWAGFSDRLGARTVRGLVSDNVNPMARTPFLPRPSEWPADSLTAAWLGHSSVLLNFYGVTILTDPALRSRIGASTALGTIGPRRLVAPALRPEQLPPIDLLLISHAHMDHLDFATLRRIPGSPEVVTAANTDDLLQTAGYTAPHTLRWGQKIDLHTIHGNVRVQAFEVKHWGARWRYDTFRGYNGYIIERDGKRMIFGGDTARTDSFAKLRRRKQPCEVALMPIGAYDPHIGSHCSPEEAVRMTNDAGAEFLLPIHFRTFPLGREGGTEPMLRLDATIEFDRVGWREIGQTFSLCGKAGAALT
jgi:L-ascorbate metabolism protein UlaG (beta-lactamase superfamily)